MDRLHANGRTPTERIDFTQIPNPPLTVTFEGWNEMKRAWEVRRSPNPALQAWKFGVLTRAGWSPSSAFAAAPLIKGFAASDEFGHAIEILWKDDVTVDQIQRVMR